MAANDALFKTIIDVTTKGAGSFVDVYYKTYDANRPSLSRFYRPTSRIIWNGTPMVGATSLGDFVNKLPSTEHDVQGYDCHPLVSSNANAGDAPDIMLIVSGSVKFGGEPQVRGFSQSFNLKQDPEKPGTYYVDSDCFRQVTLT